MHYLANGVGETGFHLDKNKVTLCVCMCVYVFCYLRLVKGLNMEGKTTKTNGELYRTG